MNKSIISIFLSGLVVSSFLFASMRRYSANERGGHRPARPIAQPEQGASVSQATDDKFFLHGLGGSPEGKVRYEWLLDGIVSLRAPELPNGYGACLAQVGEQRIARALFDTSESQKKLVVGISRGASLALHMALDSDIGAVIAESPFDCVKSVINQIIYDFPLPLVGYAAYLPLVTSIGHLITPWIHGQYRIFGKQPIDIVQDIAPDKPILLICSKQDSLIPWQSTWRLYKRLHQTGRDHVYILILERGRHGELIQYFYENGKEQFWAHGDYKKVVHAFLKKYGYPHNPALAAQGIEKLEQCRPEVLRNVSTLKKISSF